jgi:phosphoglycolate phosphatase-like HAD superfamily hydrolase
MIGDSVMDVRAAKNAGMLSIGLYRKTGASHLSELREEKPDFLVKRLDRIPRMLKTATADATRARA